MAVYNGAVNWQLQTAQVFFRGRSGVQGHGEWALRVCRRTYGGRLGGTIRMARIASATAYIVAQAAALWAEVDRFVIARAHLL